MATVTGSFNVVNGSGNYRVSVLECTTPVSVVSFTDLFGKASNGSIPYTITTPSPINISYKIKVEDLTTTGVVGQTSCNPLVCTCVGIDVNSITGVSTGLVNSTYSFTPSINFGSSPITHSWSVSGGATLTDNTSLTCSIIFPTAGSYTITYTGTNACGTDTVTKVVSITNSCLDPLPTVTLSADTTTICGSQVATITASGCTGTIQWMNVLGTTITNPNSNQSVYIVDANTAYKTVKAKCLNCNGSSSNSNTVTITYSGLCQEINSVSGSSICF
jgi:hypothetical protein